MAATVLAAACAPGAPEAFAQGAGGATLRGTVMNALGGRFDI